ncbi:uncharacterized protein LY89DRAFT_661012 [Mollisia scopiformis]|uniref:Uncharacterized protein n=1 Tax=Mollisia scopiformis TaxID=149040 RepID=A0A132B4B9_MOLSC|nr:uncharacterized protein LY89DRAFT_661012 [Mollisia scopiformis]KUJ07236.1 hypothetical protein LY89DRAFT_661012 [Mollisia scopiformis]
MNGSLDSASELLLSKEDRQLSLEDDVDRQSKVSQSPRKFFWIFFVAQALLIALYTIGSITIIRGLSSPTPRPSPPIPDLTLSYATKKFVSLQDSPFAGPPGAEVDHSWSNLVQGVNLRVSADELAVSSQSSVPLPEGGGHLAWLSVYHEIHCVKMLRQWHFRHHYFANITEKDELHWTSHAEHCLDLLLQTAICHADTSLVTFRDNPHTCVDWDQFTGSLRERVVPEEEMHRLRNPLLLFPDV